MVEKNIILRKNSFNFRWEYILIIFFILINLINTYLSPYFFDINNLLRASRLFAETGIIGVGLLLLVISGNVDMSMSAVLAVSAATMGTLYGNYGFNIIICIIVSLIVGAFCGFFNGIIIIKTGLPSIIVTLMSMSLFRGLANVLLKDQAVYGFPEGFIYLGNGTIPGTQIPISSAILIFLIIVAGIILHKTYIGKYLYAMGANRSAALLSGINNKKITLILFIIAGVIYSFSGIILSSRIGSIRPNIATGFEIEAITIIVFGGVAIYGGSGTIWGFLLAVLTWGYLRFGLSLINIPAQVMIMISGFILIISIIVSNFFKAMNDRRMLQKKS